MPRGPKGGAAVTDWEAPEIAKGGGAKQLALVALPLLFLATAITIIARPLLGAAVLVAGVLILGSVLAASGSRVLKTLGARPADEGSRAANLATGLATDMGIGGTRVWTVVDERPNAFALWHRGPNVGVTSGLLGSFTRTETEAAIAHCLVRLREEGRTPTFLTALRSFGISPPDAKMGYADVKAAAATRYPPALASALEKTVPRAGKDSLLWMVADGVGQEPVAARVEALRDL